MIGLYKAIRDFRAPDKLASFRAFAEALHYPSNYHCQLRPQLGRSTFALNSYVSLNNPFTTKNPDRTLLDVIAVPR